MAFDNLLLLKKGGKCVYNGPIAELDPYISSADKSYAIPSESNPADHALDIFCGPLGIATDWVDHYKQSRMCQRIANTVDNPNVEGNISVDSTSMPFTSELFLVLQRQVVAHWRTTTYMALRFWWTIVACLLTGECSIFILFPLLMFDFLE